LAHCAPTTIVWQGDVDVVGIEGVELVDVHDAGVDVVGVAASSSRPSWCQSYAAT
jgi:hypothetical protein